jgi:hypothetical protein
MSRPFETSFDRNQLIRAPLDANHTHRASTYSMETWLAVELCLAEEMVKLARRPARFLKLALDDAPRTGMLHLIARSYDIRHSAMMRTDEVRNARGVRGAESRPSHGPPPANIPPYHEQSEAMMAFTVACCGRCNGGSDGGLNVPGPWTWRRRAQWRQSDQRSRIDAHSRNHHQNCHLKSRQTPCRAVDLG